MIGDLRISKRMIIESGAQKDIKPTLIIGVNTKTASIIRSAIDGEIPYYPVAIAALHDDKHALNTYISNIKVYGESRIEEVVEQKGIKAAIITGTPDTDELKAIAKRLNDMGITEIKQVKILGSQHEKLEDLSIEDLLARHPKDLDIELISSFVKGKMVLITGAGGSIGSEISKQCRHFGAKKLILLDNSEYNLYQVGEQIEDAELKLVSVTDRNALEGVIKNYRPEIVIHAAAYKHVPICEANIEAALFNNIIGTRNIVDLSVAEGVDKLVVISTDKAVRPTNVMGATKRITELYANNVDAKNTEIVAVRFGNVLGSSGSVIPKFKQQIESGGPVTVTHPEITRYFMLIPEACQLVLQAAAIAKGGELFILDMGEPVKIIDLARQMIRLYGKEGEIEIVFSGLRPGEKLYEELLIDESEKKTQYDSIFTTGKTDYPIEKLKKDIETLLKSSDHISALKKIVPEFNHKL
jgi:UDP-N-acetyl-D-glucosamine 4,6-dehydratase